MAKYRARFNDKARAGGVAKRNALKMKRQKQFRRPDADNESSDNEKALKAQRIHEMARPESEARKRVRMAIQFPDKFNAAKKKRLEKYIDRQVRKEEKEDLLRKLAQTQSQVNSSSLQSLGGLGTGSRTTKEHHENENVHEDNESASTKPSSFADLSYETDSEEDLHPQSKFVDHRPTTGGFGFKSLPSKNLVKPKSKVSWREKLGIPAANQMLDKIDGFDESESNTETASESEQDDLEGEGGEGSDESRDEEEEEENEEESSGKAFMDWAKSMDPHREPSLPTSKPQNYEHKHRKTECEAALDQFNALSSMPGWVERSNLEPVLVERSEEIKEFRIKLPAIACEQQIMDSINHFDVVIITGATGSGKTSQIPQFMFEAGFAREGLIGVTQPRRVAAVSMAQRIGAELCGAAEVGFQIRFDTKVGPNTSIKLMTDGVLLKEMSSDLLLTKYSSVIVDEAHERSVNTDILISLLSRIVRLRRERGSPLKLIIMSATLRVADFAENQRLFPAVPPIVNVESRQFPITNHFSRRTAPDYVAEAIKKTLRIHERLPKGGILIFLTGKDEIQRAVAELDPKQGRHQTVRINNETATVEEENIDFGVQDDFKDAASDLMPDLEEESDLEMDPEQDSDMEEKHDQKKLHVLPLYSLLSTEDQLRVFQPVPAGHRLCVVATNVAETSLTIPGIRYVVDCGRAKQRFYDMQTGVQKFSVKYVSRASADQRSGRAGRMGPGHCYRLFSSAVYERDFPQFSDPEIVRMPVEGLVLQMKSMGIQNITNFPFPTSIPQSSLESGIDMLQNLGALDSTELQSRNKAKLTPLGRQMSIFPLHPRHAKMLLLGNQHGCLPFVVALVAALSVQELFTESPKLAPILDSQADVLQLLSAVAAYSWTPTKEICDNLGLRPKAMSEVASLRKQLARMVAQTLKRDAVATLTAELTQPLPVPTAQQLTALKQIVAAGYIDLVAARKAMFDPDVRTTSRHVSRQPYVTVQRDGPPSTVYIHPRSVMQVAPDFVVYSAMTTNNESDKVRLLALTAITETQLSVIAQKTRLITYSKPMGGAYAPKILSPTTREVWVVPRYGASAGSAGLGWDMPPVKITQTRKGSQWVNN